MFRIIVLPLAFATCVLTFAVAWRYSQLKKPVQAAPQPSAERRKSTEDRRKATRDWTLGTIRRSSDQALH